MSYCQGCGRVMAWGVTPDGKKIPLDPKAPVYRIIERRPIAGGQDEIIVERATAAMVNHHSTCPAVNKAPWKKEKNFGPEY